MFGARIKFYYYYYYVRLFSPLIFTIVNIKRRLVVTHMLYTAWTRALSLKLLAWTRALSLKLLLNLQMQEIILAMTITQHVK